MVDLSNGAKWLKIYDQFHVAQPNPSKLGQYLPIPYILIPAYLDNYTIAVFSNTTLSKPTWKLGARIYTLIEVNNSDIQTAKYNHYYTIPINISTILKINQVSTYYRLVIDVPKWFLDVYIQAWVFIGQQPIDTVEQKIDQIQSNLIRIEEKINTNYGQ